MITLPANYFTMLQGQYREERKSMTTPWYYIKKFNLQEIYIHTIHTIKKEKRQIPSNVICQVRAVITQKM